MDGFWGRNWLGYVKWALPVTEKCPQCVAIVLLERVRVNMRKVREREIDGYVFRCGRGGRGLGIFGINGSYNTQLTFSYFPYN